MAAYSAVIFGALFFTAAAFYFFTSEYLESRARSDMGRAARLAGNVIQRNLAGSAVFSRLVSGNFEIREGLTHGDIESVAEELKRELDALNVDFISVSGSDGVVLYHESRNETDEEISIIAGSEPLFLSTAFQHADETGTGAAGIEPVFPGSIAVVAIAPIAAGTPCQDGQPPGCNQSSIPGSPIGYVRIGTYIDDRFISGVKEVTGTDMAIEHRGTILSSTFDLPGNRKDAPKELLETEYLVQEVPVSSGNDVVAHLLAVYPKDEIAAVQSQGLAAIAAIAVLAFAGFFIVSAWLAGRITAPLRELARGVRFVESGDLEYRIPVTGEDELSELAQSFNRMTGALKRREAEIRRNQEQLIESGKLAAVGELAAGVAHEIGNPLAAISGYLQLLRKAPEEKTSHYISELEKEAGFIDSIIRQLLDFSRPTQKDRKLFDVSDAVDEALRMLSFHKMMKGIKINYERCDKSLKINGNYREIVQAVLNLTMNSVQAMQGEGEVNLIARATEGHVVLIISDNGPGIPRQQIQHIFEPFYTTRSAGTGLGLSITYRIIENHGGEITVRSSEGEGTQFTIRLPRAQNQEDEHIDSHEPDSSETVD